MQPSSPLLSLSPSFNTYSSGKLAEIAARVVQELRDAESQSSSSEFHYVFNNFNSGKFQTSESEVMEEDLKDVENLGIETNSEDRLLNVGTDYCLKEDEQEDGDGDDDGGDFEFSFVTEDANLSPVSADEIFCNGQIRPTFPIFNTDLLLADDVQDKVEEESNSKLPKLPKPASVRLPLRKLFIEERETASCSSSEADELEGVPPGTYCLWKPATAEIPAASCKKSNSTGSSKRWRFRDLLHRSNSDGKDTFVFLTPKKKVEKSTTEGTKVGAGKADPKAVAGANGSAVAAVHYAKKNGNRQRSFLPYRQDLVGFFANVNGLSRNVHPF